VTIRTGVLLILGCERGDQTVKPAFEVAPGEQHAPAAGLAFKTDIRTNTDDHPAVSATGVWLPQPYTVGQANWRNRNRGHVWLGIIGRAGEGGGQARGALGAALGRHSYFKPL